MTTTKYKMPAIDARHADAEIIEFFRRFFDAKNSQSPDRVLECFAPDMSAYSDGVLGIVIPGWQELLSAFEQLMPNWTNGMAYPLRILGGPDSAIVVLTDTPELFGQEIRAISSVELRGHKIARWVDYWDSSDFDDAAFESHLSPMAVDPKEFPDKFGVPSVQADPTVRRACEALHRLIADGVGGQDILTYDAVWEDMALKTQLIGRNAILRMLDTERATLPFGPGARIRHVVGGRRGGGYEWISQPGATPPVGVSAVELDDTGQISRVTVVYDRRQPKSHSAAQ
ncbi:nuclear transport factor 2 family protein [Streptomyces sp. NPDC091217]|uniref:nuclear transport factor 2 family protein n=1 Tax=Streptomyces sp. NPDC091217 TaxID=3365975 RepID=UPI00381D6A71